jgi:hypothetical protein
MREELSVKNDGDYPPWENLMESTPERLWNLPFLFCILLENSALCAKEYFIQN